MTTTIDQPVRQAGVIYVKNMIGSHWTAKEVEPSPAAIASGQVPPVPVDIPFSIHEQDKGLIRENLVAAAVQAPEVIRWGWSYFDFHQYSFITFHFIL